MNWSQLIVKTLLLFFLNCAFSFFTWCIACGIYAEPFDTKTCLNQKLFGAFVSLVLWMIPVLIFRKKDKEAFAGAIMNGIISILFFLFAGV
jgi:hypothetical protein